MKLRQLGYGALIGVTALVIAIGSATTAEAAKKKKAAAAPPPPQPIFCGLAARAPVCATRGGMKFTYANACYAAKDGASKATAGPCKAPKAAKKAGKKKKAAKKAKAKKKK